MTATEFKRPESILLVIYSKRGDALLLKRSTPPVGVWQSVSGSLLWDERPEETVRRELLEETGIVPTGILTDTGIVNRFEIVQEARRYYAADTTINTEYVYTLELPERVPVRIDPAEHSAYRWVPLSEAVDQVWSWSNKQALKSVQERFPGKIVD